MIRHMQTLDKELEHISKLLMQGRTGEANSLWNIQLGVLSERLRSLGKEQQARFLPALRLVLACQQNDDWVGMADGLRHSLRPLFKEST